jgi:hypothetical protein
LTPPLIPHNRWVVRKVGLLAPRLAHMRLDQLSAGEELHHAGRRPGVNSPLTKLPEPANLDQLKVRRRDRLGGIIHEYAQVA